jgi:hypothetical protein
MRNNAYIMVKAREKFKNLLKKGLVIMQNKEKKMAKAAKGERGVVYKVRTKRRYNRALNGITDSSKWAEKKVIAHVDGLVPEDRNECDVVIPLGATIGGKNKITIEVKSKMSPTVSDTTSYTANQVRPFRYNVVVIVVENIPAFGCDCLVYSAVDVMRKALPNLGQHTKDSMVCCNFIMRPSDAEEHGCSFHELRDRVVEAFMVDYTSDKGEFARYEINRRMREYANMCENNRIVAELLNA